MIRIQEADFDVGAEADALAAGRRDAGAVVTFTGLVRNDDGLVALTLEHYPGMTEREIARHLGDARSRWPILAAGVIHRVGRLVPGDRIVFVGIVSSHRKAAFEAGEFLMDYLKTSAPFWKHEDRADGTRWVEARSSDADSIKKWRGE